MSTPTTFTIGRNEALQIYNRTREHWSYVAPGGDILAPLPVDWLRKVLCDPTITRMVVVDNGDYIRADFMRR